MQDLKKDFFWNTLGSLVSGFVVFILTVFITRFNGVQASGEFGFAISVAAIFSAIAYYGGRNYQVTDVMGEFSMNEYVKLRLVMSMVALFAVMIFILLNNFTIEIVMLIVILMGYRVLDAISDVLYGVLQIYNKLYQAGKSNLIKSVVSIFGFVVVDYLTHNIVLASSVFIVVFILGIVGYDLRNISKIRPVKMSALYGWGVSKVAIKLLPFALIMLLPTVLNNISKYYIQLWHPEDLGYFNILILPLFFLTLVISFVVSPFLTRLARVLKKGQIARFKRAVNKLSVLTLLVGILLLPLTYLLAPPILRIIFGLGFEQYDVQLTLIVASGVLYTMAIVYSSVLIILRKINVQFILLTLLLVLNVILSVAFINPLGIDGAIGVSIVTNAIWLVAFWLVYNVSIDRVK